MNKSKNVYDEIKNMIVAKRWKPGEFFSINDLAKTLNISRSPVSVAVKRLATEGYIEIIPHRGFKVKTITKEEAIENIDIQLALEPLAVTRACENATDEQKSMLQDILSEYEKDVEARDLPGALDTDKRLHFYIFEMAGYPKLESILKSLWNQVNYYNEYFISEDELQGIAIEHGEIVDAIVNGRTDEAVEKTKKHKLRYRKNMYENFDKVIENQSTKLNITFE